MKHTDKGIEFVNERDTNKREFIWIIDDLDFSIKTSDGQFISYENSQLNLVSKSCE